jgi:HSP20 family protein
MRTLVPEGGMTSFRKEMDRFLERFWDADETPVAGAWNPRVDLSESKEALMLKAEMPGIEPKDLQLTIENGVITLQGEKRQETEETGERYYRTERNYGSFVRSLRLPANVDATKVTALFKHGVLTVTMPKAAEARGTTVPIKVA